MGKFSVVVGAAVVGFLVAGTLALLIGQAPVFQWEMAGLVVLVVAAAAGALAGAAGAASSRVGVGATVGVLLGGGAWLLSSIDHQPPALIFWGTVTAAAAAGAAGAVGGFLGSRSGITLRRRT